MYVVIISLIKTNSTCFNSYLKSLPKFTNQSLQTHVFEQLGDILFTYSLIDYFNQRGAFKNQGGDMLILSGRFVRYYLSEGLLEDALLNAMFDFCTRDGKVEDCTAALDQFQDRYNRLLEDFPDDLDIEEPI